MGKPRLNENSRKRNGLGGHMRKARIAAGLTMGEMAEKIGVSFAYIGMVEREEKRPSDKIVKRVSEITGVPFDKLIECKNPARNEIPVPRMDAAMFLHVVLDGTRTVDRAAAMAILGVDKDGLDRLMDGTEQPDDSMETALTLLAERARPGRTRASLHTVEAFLAQTERRKIRSTVQSVKDEIAAVVAEMAKIPRPVRPMFDPHPIRPYNDENACCVYFTEDGNDARWDIIAYPWLNETALDRILRTEAKPGNTSRRTAILLTDEKNFQNAVAASKGTQIPILLLDMDMKSITRQAMP